MLPITPSLHNVNFVAAKFEVATSNGFGGDAFTRKCSINFFLTFDFVVNVNQNVAQYPLHCLTYAVIKFEVTTSSGLDVDAIIRKYII